MLVNKDYNEWKYPLTSIRQYREASRCRQTLTECQVYCFKVIEHRKGYWNWMQNFMNPASQDRIHAKTMNLETNGDRIQNLKLWNHLPHSKLNCRFKGENNVRARHYLWTMTINDDDEAFCEHKWWRNQGDKNPKIDKQQEVIQWIQCSRREGIFWFRPIWQ